MIKVILVGFILVAATVVIHALGLSLLIRTLIANSDRAHGKRSATWLLIRIAWALIFIHGIEISVWALAFWVFGCLPDAASAFYFSGTTYTTIGYGDVVLVPPWRTLGPVEGLAGILMCSLSGAFFFAVVSRIMGNRLFQT